MSKYIITGAGFGNKGAESMLYTLITELRTKEYNSEIVVICQHGYENINLSDFDNIKFLKEDMKPRKDILNPIKLFIDKITNNHTVLEWYNEFFKSDCIIDISGYCLSSQWTKSANRRFLSTIKLANKFKKKIILMPQSFGPFDYTKKHKITTKDVKKWLSKVNLICAREKDGYNKLKELGLNNVVLSSDMVLQNTLPYQYIYKKEIENPNIDIKTDSVLVIPSQRVLERSDENEFLEFYKVVIKNLLANQYNVYISYYDSCDYDVCKKIKALFPDNENIQFIEQDMNCIEYSYILPKFKFLITSRFHSAVHAYKHYIPCMVIGWAVKYKELTAGLEQSDYLFDCRNNINIELFLNKLKQLTSNIDTEKERIKQNVITIQNDNCFDKMWRVISNEK